MTALGQSRLPPPDPLLFDELQALYDRAKTFARIQDLRAEMLAAEDSEHKENWLTENPPLSDEDIAREVGDVIATLGSLGYDDGGRFKATTPTSSDEALRGRQMWDQARVLGSILQELRSRR